MVKSQRGVTLTELMVVVTIIGIMSFLLSTLFTGLNNFWRSSSAKNAIQQDARVALDTIDRFTRQAKGGTVVIDQVSGQPPFSRIAFSTIQGWNISFYQQGNALYMKNNGKVSVLSSHLAYIAFFFAHSDDPSLISITMATQAATYLGANQSFQVSLENLRIMN